MIIPKVLIVGYGSIGAKHADLLQAFGCEVMLVSKKSNINIRFPIYQSISQAISVAKPTHVIISSPTAIHAKHILELQQASFTGKLLVEKPLFSDSDDLLNVNPESFEDFNIAYVLRYHPYLEYLHSRHLTSSKTIIVQAHCGQYLPDWRSIVNFRDSYSAKSQLGGGVLRDLSHELDYLTWLFGELEVISAQGGNYGILSIDADENWHIHLRGVDNESIIIQLSLNYFDRPSRRFINIICEDHFYYADFIKSEFYLDGEEKNFDKFDGNTMYINQLKDWIYGKKQNLATFEQSISVQKMFNKIEKFNAVG